MQKQMHFYHKGTKKSREKERQLNRPVAKKNRVKYKSILAQKF
jgi:hypothetical protein